MTPQENGGGVTAEQMGENLLGSAADRIRDLEAELKALGIGYHAWADEAERLADRLLEHIQKMPYDIGATAAAWEALRAHLAQR